MKLVHTLEAGERTGVALDVTENSRLCWTDLNACRQQALCNPVIAERAFVCNIFFRMEVPGTIRTRLDAIPATDAPVFIDQDDAVFRLERRADGANLNARWIVALITELRHEETPHDLLLAEDFLRLLNPRIDALNGNFTIFLDHIAFNPRTEEERFLRNIVLIFAGFHTLAATNALIDLYPHTIIMSLGIVRR